MLKLSLSVLAAGVFALNATANSNVSDATYILKVASNLHCEALEISIGDQSSGERHTLTFGAGAYSATALPAGTYAFGDVTCHKGKRDTETFGALNTQIAPFSLSGGQVYFGGELVVQADAGERAQTPELLDNCIRGTGPSGGEYTGECQAGDGVSGEPLAERTVRFYTRQLSANEVDQVQTALKSDQELIYLPITPTGS